MGRDLSCDREPMYTEKRDSGALASQHDEAWMRDKQILVVDDEQNILEVVCVYLEQEGFVVRTATDGEQALAAARQFEPDLIVLDLQLPRLNGLDLMRTLRSEQITPIIILTARGQETDRVVGLE